MHRKGVGTGRGGGGTDDIEHAKEIINVKNQLTTVFNASKPRGRRFQDKLERPDLQRKRRKQEQETDGALLAFRNNGDNPLHSARTSPCDELDARNLMVALQAEMHANTETNDATDAIDAMEKEIREKIHGNAGTILVLLTDFKRWKGSPGESIVKHSDEMFRMLDWVVSNAKKLKTVVEKRTKKKDPVVDDFLMALQNYHDSFSLNFASLTHVHVRNKALCAEIEKNAGDVPVDANTEPNDKAHESNKENANATGNENANEKEKEINRRNLKISDFFEVKTSRRESRLDRVFFEWYWENVTFATRVIKKDAISDLVETAQAVLYGDKGNKKTGKGKHGNDSTTGKPSIRQGSAVMMGGNRAQLQLPNGTLVDYCLGCNAKESLRVDARTSETVCTSCGAVFPGMTTHKVTFEQSQMLTAAKENLPYQRISHLKEFLTRMSGQERTVIPEKVLLCMLKELAKMNINPLEEPEKVTQELVRRFLNINGYSKFYENITKIIWILTQRRPVHLPDDVRDRIVQMFFDSQEPFDKFKNEFRRKNFISYSYFVFKCCEMLGCHDFLPKLRLLIGPQNRVTSDAIWMKICEYNGWEYIQTVD